MSAPTDHRWSQLPPGGSDIILRNDFASFVREVFAVLNPSTPLIWDAYLDLICARVQAVVDGKIRRLIINLPPRHLKSICVSVALPAYFLGHHPSLEVMCVSYNQKLAKGFGEDTKAVMASEFYSRIFPTRLANGRQSVSALRTSARGARRATSMQGTATGVGADLLIFDDPQKANEIESEKVRTETNELYRSTFLSRANNPTKSRTIICMQRLHEDDFVGAVTALGPEWEVLKLPVIAEEDEAIGFETFMGRHTYRRAQGAALHPLRLPLPELDEIREQVGEAVWATQYMQRPAPAGGGVVNIAWFKRYADADLPEHFDQVVQSWDIASTTGQTKDFSVCTTWGTNDKRVFLLDVFRKRLIYPDLKKAVIEQAALHSATAIVIEDHNSGTPLIQDLQREGVPKIQAYKPQGDKKTRMEGQTGPIAAGHVYIPHEAHWLAEYLHELAVFPNGRHDDQVDSTSQALDSLNNVRIKGYAYLEMARRANIASGRRPPTGPQKIDWAIGCVEWQAEQDALAAAKAASG